VRKLFEVGEEIHDKEDFFEMIFDRELIFKVS
jgi:hypothetical protein